MHDHMQRAGEVGSHELRWHQMIPEQRRVHQRIQRVLSRVRVQRAQHRRSSVRRTRELGGLAATDLTDHDPLWRRPQCQRDQVAERHLALVVTQP
jgi:hypothetical protein